MAKKQIIKKDKRTI